MGGFDWNQLNGLTYNDSSDRRLKTHIKDTKRGINDLLKVKVRDFNWKWNPNSTTTGFIAQELYKVSPHLATRGTGSNNPEDVMMSPWSARPLELIPILVKSIQDQQKMIDELKQEVNLLKNKS